MDIQYLFNEKYKEELENFLRVAWGEVSSSSCKKKKVGAIIFNLDSLKREVSNIMAYGHGGPITPCEMCVRDVYRWESEGCWSVHAELRALFNYFSNHGFSYNLSHVGVATTHGPCDQCLKYLTFFKIPVVIYDKYYKADYSKWEDRILIKQVPLEYK